MKSLLTSFIVFSLSFGAFAVDEMDTLRYVLASSHSKIEKLLKESERKFRGIQMLKEMGERTKEELGVLAKRESQLKCETDAYGMLLNVSKKYIREDALSSSFVTRSDLGIKGDDMLSLFDFFIQPYLEFVNYKTDYLTAALNESQFRTNEDKPFFIDEINVKGYCLRNAQLKHYGEDGKSLKIDLDLPKSVIVNDVARSKKKTFEREIQRAEDGIRSARSK